MITNRIEKVQAQLEKNSAAFISNTASLVYLTELTHSEGYLLLFSDNFYYLTDSRYTEAAKKVINSQNVIEFSRPLDTVNKLLKRHNANMLYIEPESVSVSQFEKIKNALNGVMVLKDKKIQDKITLLREIKDDREIENIKQAQKITDNGFSYILQKIKKGVTERQIALDLEFFMRKEGSDGVSFDIIAISGKNTSMPHGVPTDKVIEDGDFVTLDFGAVVNGYHSDMTRTVAVGGVSDEQINVYNTVLKAQQAALESITAGKKCSDIDKIARDIIANAGYGQCFRHALGHGVGVEIHESPNFSPKSEKITQMGNIITVEPGIYIENKFGVRIEDMICVTENGILNFTHSPKELIIV